MKRYFAGIMACLMLGIYGCSSGGGITTTSNSVDTTKTASVKLAADFGGGEVQTAFYKDIDNITITYSAGCAETQNYFEYYFVDNRTADLYKSGSIFLNSFFDSLYDLWVKPNWRSWITFLWITTATTIQVRHGLASILEDQIVQLIAIR